MKTTHQLAWELLAMPDVRVAIIENDDIPIMHDPRLGLIEGRDLNDDDYDLVEIFGKHAVCFNAQDTGQPPVDNDHIEPGSERFGEEAK